MYVSHFQLLSFISQARSTRLLSQHALGFLFSIFFILVHWNLKLRTAPQSCDQSFEHKLNKTLKASADTKNPVRVIRGFKLPSEYAPKEGYRYDGLYVVEKVRPLFPCFNCRGSLRVSKRY